MGAAPSGCHRRVPLRHRGKCVLLPTPPAEGDGASVREVGRGERIAVLQRRARAPLRVLDRVKEDPEAVEPGHGPVRGVRGELEHTVEELEGARIVTSCQTKHSPPIADDAGLDRRVGIMRESFRCDALEQFRLIAERVQHALRGQRRRQKTEAMQPRDVEAAHERLVCCSELRPAEMRPGEL